MISLESVSLRYPLMGHYSHSLQSYLGNVVGGIMRTGSKNIVEYVSALNDVSLKIEDGSRVGIVGHNGAGKTTLLRVITGVYPPTSGSVKVVGNISALTDFTLGMDQNSSGVKNIIFRLVFMGYSFRQAKSAVDDIVDFSGLGEFINMPVRTYSTGMFLRLAFAISTHFTPDILVLDEIIGAGDEAFRSKAKQRLDKLIEGSRIVVLSSHDLASVKSYCDRAILLNKGRVSALGTPADVIDKYITGLN